LREAQAVGLAHVVQEAEELALVEQAVVVGVEGVEDVLEQRGELDAAGCE
jgi:hypothetical protein